MDVKKPKAGMMIVETPDGPVEVKKSYVRSLAQEIIQTRGRLTGHAEQLMRALLLRHPDADKRGCGIKAIEVRQNLKFPKDNMFWLIREDGTEDDFSFNLCLSGVDKTPKQAFVEAARQEIFEQIARFKHAFFDATPDSAWLCPISGVPITPDTSHVDHAPPHSFDNMILDFVDIFSIDLTAVQTVRAGGERKGFIDRDLALAWQRYHAENAVLRVVDAQANMQQGKGEANEC